MNGWHASDRVSAAPNGLACIVNAGAGADFAAPPCPPGDPEMAELAREEVETLQQQIESQGDRLKFLLLPKDPLDEKNIMLEVWAPFFTFL